MSNGVITGAFLAGVVVWILVVRQLTAKSWEGRHRGGDVAGIEVPPARLGLWIFMAVVASLFTLFMSAYATRRHMGADWAPITVPRILWINTALLVISSIAMERARGAVKRGRLRELKLQLPVAGAFTLAFIAGQLLAWQQFAASGQLLQSSPAAAFFYVLTAVHGLHLLGGLTVWGRTAGRLAGGAEIIAVRQSVELCAVYWHFMLLVWLVVFALLMYA